MASGGWHCLPELKSDVVYNAKKKNQAEDALSLSTRFGSDNVLVQDKIPVVTNTSILFEHRRENRDNSTGVDPKFSTKPTRKSNMVGRNSWECAQSASIWTGTNNKRSPSVKEICNQAEQAAERRSNVVPKAVGHIKLQHKLDYTRRLVLEPLVGLVIQQFVLSLFFKQMITWHTTPESPVPL